MQRKNTPQSPGAKAEEKRFMKWVKFHDCIACGCEGPSIVDHCFGSSFRINKLLVGHWFLLPLCVQCNNLKTLGSIPAFSRIHGTLSYLWSKLIIDYPHDIPEEIKHAISTFRR